jgi:peptidoglycan/xylan/chitin deacetylase (PgdA/CDA1 family)
MSGLVEGQPRRLAILAYHKVANPPAGRPTWFYIDEEVFVQHLHYLRDAGWQPLDLATLLHGLEDPAVLPSNAVLITFDDGYQSNLTVAAPHLLRAGFPAIVFIATGMIGRLNEFDRDIEPPEVMCDWSDLCALADHGIAVQSHGISHTRFSELTAVEIESELRGSREALEERLHRAVTVMSYPFGDAGRNRSETRAILARAGYRAACSYADDEVNRLPGADPLFLARFAIGRDTDLAALLGSSRQDGVVV